MPEISVHAIVLRRRDSGESDRRLTILTPELGKVDVVAKGARKSASRLGSVSEPLATAILGIAEGKRNRFIVQAQPLSSFKGLRSDFDRLSFALALVELYASLIPLEEPIPEAFDLLNVSLRQIELHRKPLIALVWAECRLLELSGFLPQFDRCVGTEAQISIAEPYVSPMAGGYISDVIALRYGDRFRVRAEVLYGLARLPDLDAPPEHLKFADQTLATLLPFWRAITDMPLPANESVIKSLQAKISAQTPL